MYRLEKILLREKYSEQEKERNMLEMINILMGKYVEDERFVTREIIGR